MVKFWDIALDKAIITTKARIKFCEKHGNGIEAIREKARLKLQERKKELKSK